MSDEPKRCKVEIIPDDKDWKLKLTGDCETLKQEIDKLPPTKRGYLQRRIEGPEEPEP